ncbi:MAG: HD-GYP domain-containing protein [Actinomycetota bacterium]|nr:HD-GYP domain-containing protein [Actinomycetota bacterium]
MADELPDGIHHFPSDEFPRALPKVPLPFALLGLYLSLSVLWILVSDRVATAVFDDHAAESWVQTVKGIGFVVVTATVMTLAVATYVRRSNADRQALEDAWDETILGWALAMDARESNLALHSQRGADLTLLLARRMNVPDRQLRDLYRGALLHDIGKFAVPEEVLNFPGPLNDEQWALIRQHPDRAVRLLAPIEFLRAAIDIPQSHHEKWDGSGYPRGLSGTDIPLWARIFAVVDVYDAITSKRSYHDGASHERAMEIIRADSGTHFDPVVVAVFEELMSRGNPLDRDAIG